MPGERHRTAYGKADGILEIVMIAAGRIVRQHSVK
jgi:hypothetical protein